MTGDQLSIASEPFDADVLAFLEAFRAQHSVGEILGYVDALKPLRVMVIGEAIIDEYVFVEPLGKSAKDSTIAAQELSREAYAGGALAIANHIAGFSSDVVLSTYVGAEGGREPFIREHLLPNISTQFVTKAGSPTVLKRRFIDQYSGAKLFETYEINDAPLTAEEDATFCTALAERLPACDVVIVADFGHGLISERAIAVISEHARFLAVNTQMNAANIGFNTISRYPRADYISLQEREIRLDVRDRHGDLATMISALSDRTGCETVMVTRGKFGTSIYRRGEGVTNSPAVTRRITDRIGAGDALLALTSLCAMSGVPADVLGFLGNVAGARIVGTLGNSTPLTREDLVEEVQLLMDGTAQESLNG